MPAGSRRKRPAGLGRFGAKPAAADETHGSDADVPQGLAGAYVRSKLREKTIREAGLHEPTDPFEGTMPDLPDDIDSVDHSQLSNLMLSFQNALSTALWRASRAYIEADIYEEIADYLEARALLGSEQSNDAKRRAESRTDDQVLAWRGSYKAAYHDYVSFRDLSRTIEGKIKALSRVGGFKDDDNDAGDRSARSKQSAGASRGTSRRRSRS